MFLLYCIDQSRVGGSSVWEEPDRANISIVWEDLKVGNDKIFRELEGG